LYWRWGDKVRIFIDVGSYQGQTINRVLNPAFGVELIYGFEPSPSSYAILKRRFRKKRRRVRVFNFGLWSENCTKTLYYEGTRGATILSDYVTIRKASEKDVECSFVKASDWFRDNLSFSDEIFLKLNCEGSECDIVNDLLDSREFSKLKAVLIDYDVRKSPSQRYKQKKLEKRLSKLNITNVYKYMGKNRIEVLWRVMNG